MLGLATHEPNFTIIREEFKPNKPRPCALCGQMGHEIKDCQGTAREKQGEVRLKVMVVWCVADSVHVENLLLLADHLTRITMSRSSALSEIVDKKQKCF